MSETSTESNQQSLLTEEQKLFLKQCEDDFANRFTDTDEEYVVVRDRVKSLPPIEDPWKSSAFRDRDRDRDRDRGGRYRDFRDRGDRGDRDNWRNRYGRDNYHSRYDNRHENRRNSDPYNRYNRSPYSNYYRK